MIAKINGNDQLLIVLEQASAMPGGPVGVRNRMASSRLQPINLRLRLGFSGSPCIGAASCSCHALAGQYSKRSPEGIQKLLYYLITNWLFTLSSVTVSPSCKSPERIFLARRVSTCFWRYLFSGLAPKPGS